MNAIRAAAEISSSLRNVGDKGDQSSYTDVLADEGAVFLVWDLAMSVFVKVLETYSDAIEIYAWSCSAAQLEIVFNYFEGLAFPIRSIRTRE